MMTQETDSISTAIAMTPEIINSHADTLNVLNKMSPPHLTNEGPIAIPIVTVEIDNANLVFEREGCKECTKKEECCAHLINGPPSLPLNEYTGPGAHSGLCILCKYPKGESYVHPVRFQIYEKKRQGITLQKNSFVMLQVSAWSVPCLCKCTECVAASHSRPSFHRSLI